MKPSFEIAGASVSFAVAWLLALIAACNAPAERAVDVSAQRGRGEYLSKLLGCPSCHGGAGRGGLEGREQDRVWRASNITPHEGTGIGRWSDAQIVAAVRKGVRPDGERIDPIMPYGFYARLSDEDAAALVAFLRALAPIENAIARPVYVRPAHPVTPSAATPARSDVVRRGEYLVAIMHCAHCHATPDANGQPDPDKPFAGGREMQPFGAGLARTGEETLFASNLTPDRETGIGAWTEAQIAKSVTTLTRPDGSLIRGPMQFYLAGWAALEERDARAIAAYLKQLAPIENRVPRRR